jgi:hypothetical protein
MVIYCKVQFVYFNVETIFENIFVCGWLFAENVTGAKLISKKAFDILDVCPNLDFQMLCMHGSIFGCIYLFQFKFTVTQNTITIQ